MKQKASSKFDWLYFDVHQQDGYDFVFSFHILPFMSQFRVSIFDAFVYRNNRLLFHKYLVMPWKNLQIKNDGNKIFYPLSPHFLFDRNHEHLKLNIQSNKLELNLEMHNVLKVQEPLKITLLSELEALRTFEWNLFMPITQAQGWLRYRKKGSDDWRKFSILGQGYHDGNRGAFNLKKELKSWLWMKIYQGEQMWIIGKIISKYDRMHPILVRVTPYSLKFTFAVQFHSDAQSLHIKSDLGNLSLKIIENHRLDDLRFLVNTWPKFLSNASKAREILAAAALEHPALKCLRNTLTNGKYRRRRWVAETRQGEKAAIFGEEMILNE